MTRSLTSFLVAALLGSCALAQPLIFDDLPHAKVPPTVPSKAPRVNVSHISAQFGAGGHRIAAGARLKGPIHVAA